LRGKPVNFRERHSTSPNYIPQRPLEQPHKPGISSETGWLSRFRRIREKFAGAIFRQHRQGVFRL